MAKIRDLVIRIGVTTRYREIDRLQKQLRQLQRQVKSTDKDTNRLSTTFSRLGHSITSGVGSALSKLYSGAKLATVGIGAVAVAAGGLHTSIQLVGGLGSALAPLAGLLAAIPAAAVTAAAGLTTFKLATYGVGDAFKALFSGNQEKLDKALEKISPAARSVVMEFKRMLPVLKGIQQTAQQQLFLPLRGQLTAVLKVLGGPLRMGVAVVAHEFAMAAVEAAKFARSASGVALVKTAFGSVAGGLREIRPAIQPLLTGFAQLATVGAQFLVNLTPGIRDAVIAFGQFMSSAAQSGRAMAWMQNGLLVLKQLGSLLANVGGIVMSFFRAAGTAGSNFLGTLGSLAAQLNAFLKTAAGQQALTSFFQGLAAISMTLGPVLAALVTQIGALAPVVGQLATMIGPILTSAINAVGPALATLQPALAALFTALNVGVAVIAPALVPLGRVIAQLAVALTPLITIFATLVDVLVRGLAPALGPLIGALGQGLVTAGSAVVRVAAPLAAAFSQFLQAITPLLPQIGLLVAQLVTGLVPVLVPLVGTLWPAFARIISAVLQAVTPLVPVISQLAGIFAQGLANAIVAMTPGLVTLLGLFGQILQVALPALVPLVTIVSDLVQVLSPLLPVIVGIVGVLKLWTIVQMALNTVLLANPILLIVAALALLVGGLIAAWKHCETFRNIVTGALNGVAMLFRALGGIVVAAVKAGFGALVSIAKPPLDALVYVVKVALGLIITPFYYLYQALKTITVSFWSWAGPYVARGIKVIVNAVMMPLRALLAAWNAIWRAIGPTVTGAFNAVIRAIASAGGTVLRSVVNLGSAIINVFRGAGSWLYNAGRNIVVGLWNGIVSLASWIARSIGNLISRIIPGPVKRVLGIRSPSKVMAQLGVYVGQGLAVGMASMQRTVASAAANLANAAVPTMAPPAMAGVAPPTAVAPVGATAVGGSGASGGIDYDRMARANVAAFQRAGLTIQVDRTVLGQVVSSENGRRTQQQRRTG